MKGEIKDGYIFALVPAKTLKLC